MIWKVFGWSGKCPDDLKSGLFRWSAQCVGDLESVPKISKISKSSIKCAFICKYTFCEILSLHWHWYQNCCLTHFYNAPVSALYLASFFMEKKEGRRRALPSIQFSWNFYQIISGTKNEYRVENFFRAHNLLWGFLSQFLLSCIFPRWVVHWFQNHFLSTTFPSHVGTFGQQSLVLHFIHNGDAAPKFDLCTKTVMKSVSQGA